MEDTLRKPYSKSWTSSLFSRLIFLTHVFSIGFFIQIFSLTKAISARTIVSSLTSTTSPSSSVNPSPFLKENSMHSAVTNTHSQSSPLTLIRVGYFPNLTHAQAIIAKARGDFQNIGSSLPISIRNTPTGINSHQKASLQVEFKMFNAGPSAVEALFANELDFAYLGPNPALNAFVKSKGKALKILAGACSGGAQLILNSNSTIQKPSDFNGKTVATPQIGNTQDVAARMWFHRNGVKAHVISVGNSEQLNLFRLNQLEGVWTVEPWATKLILEAKGRVFLEEKQLWTKFNGKYPTTLLVVNEIFRMRNQEIVKSILQKHIELTQWIINHPQDALSIVHEEIEKITHQKWSKELFATAWNKIEFTPDTMKDQMIQCAHDAFDLGYLGKEFPLLNHLYVTPKDL